MALRLEWRERLAPSEQPQLPLALHLGINPAHQQIPAAPVNGGEGLQDQMTPVHQSPPSP